MEAISPWFQSTPPRGGRRWHGRRCSSPGGFNPRPRAGGDNGPWKTCVSFPFQSTPPRGGRPDSTRRPRGGSQFQSTPPRGGRPPGTGCSSPSCGFQSTPPRGGRPAGRGSWSSRKCFNPRPRAGGDTVGGAAQGPYSTFQSTPPRGGRLPPHCARAHGRGVSIHAPARGATRGLHLAESTVLCFNPRPRAGGDTTTSAKCPSRASFQSTPPRGGRP